MLKITLIAVGGLKDKYWIQASSEYEKRLSPFCELNIIEIPAARLPDTPSSAQVAAALEAEEKQIFAKLPRRCFTVAMCVEGRQMSSPALAKCIADWAGAGRSRLCFLVGGSCGLSERIKGRADLRLSVSEMTFPHHLFRVMLAEQVYRAFNILEGGRYHK